ncbi:MAG: hypothetical protein WC788_08645 [Candidatus Paceibacterota bacterium]|jgi:hypothetical protein
MKYKIIILLVLAIFISLLADRLFFKYAKTPCTSSTDNPIYLRCTNNDNGDKDGNKDIVYKTFSSPEADFTFEYPDTWTYGKSIIEDTIVWNFYINSEKNPSNSVLEVHFPTYETVDFCSIGYKGTKNPYQLNTFPTNDPETFITYEQCSQSQNGDGYIYWQKGEYFANAGLISDILKTNLMIFHYNSAEGRTIAQHISESITIK